MISKERIKDNSSFVELEQQIKGVETLAGLLKFLSFFGVKNIALNETSKIPEMTKTLKLLASIPDKFNEYFANSGWIAYESMNFDLMKEAVELADNNELSKSQDVLVNYYREENLKWMVLQLNGIAEFRPRMNLIQKAYEDYLAERYHACIPVLLMMIDGVVNDIEQKGFFADGTDLTAWDSIAAHSTGLNELAKIFRKSRKKIVTDEIDVPYRNGILHGRDLGYANKTVAAKTWAALFAVRDWAGAIKAGKKEPKEETKKPSLSETIVGIRDSLDEYARNNEISKKISQWKARVLKVNIDFPESGNVSEYAEGGPERALIEFVDYWSKHNYGKMAGKMTLMSTKGKILKNIAGNLRDIFNGKEVLGYRILEIIDVASAISEIKVEFELKKAGKVINHISKFRMIYENQNGDPSLRGEPNGSWKIIIGYQDFEYI